MRVVNLNEITPDWAGGEIFVGAAGRQSMVTDQMALHYHPGPYRYCGVRATTRYGVYGGR